MQRRDPGIASYARSALLPLMLAAASGCGEAVVDVMAVWVDGIDDDGGARRHVRVYEAGERNSLAIVPDMAGTALEQLTVGVDPRARGVVLADVFATVWIERESGRRAILTATDVDRPEEVEIGFSFTRNGDAILRSLDVKAEEPPAWLLGTLAGPSGPRSLLLQPPEPAAPGLRWVLHHASEAPVLVLAEIGGSPSSVQGRVRAFAYPSELGQGPVVDTLTPLGQGTLQGRGLGIDVTSYVEAPACPDRLCLSPSGRWLYFMEPSGGCFLQRWSWQDGAVVDEDLPSEPIAIACPGERVAALTAVLDDDLVVLDDPFRVYLVDVSAGTVSSVPKPQGLLTTRLADDGRVLLVMSQEGEIVRVDAAGPRIISAVQAPCLLNDGLAVSRSGNWIVRVCNGQNGLPDGVDGQVQRVSALGSELYSGIPMRPVAVDDEGNALMYSVGSNDDDGVPRGLFVLSGDGKLSRVDELEPAPGLISTPNAAGERVPARFTAAGPT